MKEYQFQFTKGKGTVLVLFVCFIVFTIIIYIGVNLLIDKYLLVVIGIIAMFLTFRLLKKSAVSSCTAKLNDDSVEFKFQNDSKIINFSDLISFKAYYGKNGPILYLKSNDENFKISANNNFCKTEDFCSLTIGNYIYTGNYGDMYFISYNGQDEYAHVATDSMSFNVTSYKNGLISGNFSGQLTPLVSASTLNNTYGAPGSTLITDGSFQNVPVFY